MSHIRSGCPRLLLLALALLFVTLGCVAFGPPGSPVDSPKVSQETSSGYLTTNELPNSLTLLPPPPPPDSAEFAADEDAYRLTRALRDTPRWDLAVEDAALLAETFSCALEAPIGRETAPHLYELMLRSRFDAGHATGRAKKHYKRVRPFAMYGVASCTPHDEPVLMQNGSFPSGHASIGWTWALILSEIAPDRTDALLERGYAYGQSRVICGMHWQSDVEAGRLVAAGVVARLHADPAFRAQVETARAELADTRSKGLKPTRDCKAEAAVLAFTIPGAP
jgi:acid phosphatase (class A)